MAKCMLNPSYPSRPPLDRHHLAILHRERQPAVLERERLVAKKLAPPAVQGRHVGIVVVGDLLELVDGGDHLGGDRVALRRHAQQHLEELHGGGAVAAPALALNARQALRVAREPARHRLQDVLAPFRALEPARQRAQGREPLDRGRRLLGDLAHHVVLEHAAARHVASLRLALAPGRDLHQHGELLGLAHPRLEPVPGELGLDPVGVGRGEHLHLLAHPLGAAALVQVAVERQKDVAQVGDIGDRVLHLRGAERPLRPVGEAVRLVERVAGDALHELVVGDRVAIAEHHGGDLGVEDRMRDQARLVPDDLDVLARGVKHLEHALVRHQLVERLEVEALGERIDHDRLVGARHLGDAQQGVVCGFAQELGVDRDVGVAGQAVAGFGEVLRRRDQLHDGSITGVLRSCRGSKSALSSRTTGGGSQAMRQHLKCLHVLRQALIAAACLLSTALAAREVEDATGRRIVLPDQVTRVMAAGPTAAVVLYVLAPGKMIAWPSAPRPNEREFILPAVRDLPELGRLTGRGDTANVEVVLKARPDVIFDYGSVSPTFSSLAARVQEQTGLPYLLFDGRLDRTPASIRKLGDTLGVADRAEQIARYVEETERMIDARLKDVPAAARRRVYLAREPNGLETGLTGSINTEIIERAGGVNVAERGAARGGIANVSIEQVLACAPDTIITWDPRFFESYASDPVWATVPAVRAKRVFLAPRLPFGWIDAPPSINRVIGLRWIAGLLYSDKFPEDIRAAARDFIKLFYQADVTDQQIDRILVGAQPGGRGR